jgi:hypothetical protein
MIFEHNRSGKMSIKEFFEIIKNKKIETTKHTFFRLSQK